MRYIIVMLAVVMASMSFSSIALSDENSSGMPNEYGSNDSGQYKSYEMKSQKDECLIVAKNCINGNESVMQRVERLQKEIAKGESVYTPEELKSFQNQLNWIYSESGEFSGKTDSSNY